MAVIGRLDEQVDDVMIKPLSKRGEIRGAYDEQEDQSNSITQIDTQPKLEGSENSVREKDELPVWLL